MQKNINRTEEREEHKESYLPNFVKYTICIANMLTVGVRYLVIFLYFLIRLRKNYVQLKNRTTP